jgi:hypothetical protein
VYTRYPVWLDSLTEPDTVVTYSSGDQTVKPYNPRRVLCVNEVKPTYQSPPPRGGETARLAYRGLALASYRY